MKLTFLHVAVATLFLSGLSALATAEMHVVGGSMGWTVPSHDRFAAYERWAAARTFRVGDILVFNFTSGEDEGVAQVSENSFLRCEPKNPLSLKKTSPANYTLDKEGWYYFIAAEDDDCLEGQKLVVYVRAVSANGPTSSPRGPVTYRVGDDLEWVVPPGGSVAYAAWAHNKSFLVGDTLVFNFKNGTQDVVEAKEAAEFESCQVNSIVGLWTSSPAKINLTRQGSYYFTSTYPRHCHFGQKLTINVTAAGGGATAEPPSSPSQEVSAPSPSPLAGGPASVLPVSPATSPSVAGVYFLSFLLSAIVVSLY